MDVEQTLSQSELLREEQIAADQRDVLGLYAAFPLISGDDDALELEDRADPGFLDTFRKMRNVLDASNLWEMFGVDPQMALLVDVDHLTEQFREFNSQLAARQTVVPDSQTMHQLAEIKRLFDAFARQYVIRDATTLLNAAGDTLKRYYPDAGSEIDSLIDRLLTDDPLLIINPMRLTDREKDQYTVLPERGSVTRPLCDMLPVGVYVELRELYRDLQSAFPKRTHAHAIRENPEADRLANALIGDLIGVTDLFLAVIPPPDRDTGQTKPDGYISSGYPELPHPDRGLKIHVSIDTLSPDYPKIIKAVSAVARNYGAGMKAQRITSAFTRNEKGITVYPPFDEGKADAAGQAENFRTAIVIAKAIDDNLSDVRQRFPIPFRTDLAVGSTNRVSLRYGNLKKRRDTYPDGWSDDPSRLRPFAANFPTEELWKSALDALRIAGLID